jgi:hypothetical protein
MLRKTWALSLVLVLLMASLAGCAMGSQTKWPDRQLTVSVDEALAAQDAAVAGLAAGSAELTESQFSSLLSVGLQQNSGPNNPIKSISAWFEKDNQVFLRVQLGDGVMMGGNTVDLVGKIAVKDQHVNVDIQEAGANGYSVAGDAIAPVNAWINHFLADPNLGVIVNVTTDTGKITLGLGG